MVGKALFVTSDVVNHIAHGQVVVQAACTTISFDLCRGKANEDLPRVHESQHV